MSAEDRSLRRFAGDDEADAGKQLRRFKQWASAKMMTVKDLRKEQRGPWVYTLLDGKAWDAVEHLSLEQISTENGEAVVAIPREGSS